MAPIVETRHGRFEGEARGNHLVFRGIGYARPPLGALRFCAPEPPEPHAGVRSAHAFGPSAMQGESAIPGMAAPGPKSEDCLYLNVYTPALDGARRPVLFWIHGGAFTLGSASAATYDGARLCERGDVVVVTINYRLGVFGYLSLLEHGGADWGATANAGQLDQIAALRWVQGNIERFGGDPDNVLIFGESAGSMAVCTLLAMPAAKGLFHRAVAQSGANLKLSDARKAAELTSALLDKLGLANGQAERLRAWPANELIDAQAAVGAERGIRLGLAPIVDGMTLPSSPGARIAARASAEVPLVIGTNRDEMNLFTMPLLKQLDQPMSDGDAAKVMCRQVPELSAERAIEMLNIYRRSRQARGLPSTNRALLGAVQTDLSFRIPALRFAEAYLAVQPSTFAYYFTYESPAMRGALRACHALEIPFVFGTLDAPFQDRFAGSGPEVERLSEVMMDTWLAFARNGVPHAAATSTWRAYEAQTRPTMVFDRESRLELAPHDEERAAWDGLL